MLPGESGESAFRWVESQSGSARGAAWQVGQLARRNSAADNADVETVKANCQHALRSRVHCILLSRRPSIAIVGRRILGADRREPFSSLDKSGVPLFTGRDIILWPTSAGERR